MSGTRPARRGESVVLRADASPTVGIGHIARCVALAEAWIDGGGRAILVSAGPRTIIQALASDIEVTWLGERPPAAAEDARYFLTIVQEMKASAAVIDSYSHPRSWESEVRAEGVPLLAVDDSASREHDCDIVLDTSLSSADAERYRGRVPNDAQLMLGTSYVLVRRAFCNRQYEVRAGPAVGRLLVSFGGTDPLDYTSAALGAIAMLGQTSFKVDVVTSSANPHLTRLRRSAATLPRVALHVDEPNMAGLMARADLALGACGSGSWERCLAGLPALVAIVAGNQEAVAQLLEAEGVVKIVGGRGDLKLSLAQSLSAALTDRDWRVSASRRAMQLVDGRGAERVSQRLREVFASSRRS